ncbi:6-pyruvoyl tetrahydropterin synthase [Chromatium weissei]|nr:6-pyruvoyl tetrahydropterin synthase [Chromatium weissei]
MTEKLFYFANASFHAARQLPNLPDGHAARRLHGHNFVARVRAQLPTDCAQFAGAATGQLNAALTEQVAALDYRNLNEIMPIPSDAALALWLRERLALPESVQLGVESTADQGAVVNEAGEIEIWRRWRFEAAHRLPNVPAGHQCGRMHGHSFEVIVHAALLPKTSVNFQQQLDALWQPLYAELHHACLNEISGLENPTSELLAQWLWQRFAPQLPTLRRVTVCETATAGCHFDGQQFRIWKEQRFESAVQFPAALAGDGRGRLHGHSYLLRLLLSAPLDAVLGWTVDYGDVKSLFMPIYRQLDHHQLDQLPQLVNADPIELAQWIRAKMAAVLPALDGIEIEETAGNGAGLWWVN